MSYLIFSLLTFVRQFGFWEFISLCLDPIFDNNNLQPWFVHCVSLSASSSDSHRQCFSLGHSFSSMTFYHRILLFAFCFASYLHHRLLVCVCCKTLRNAQGYILLTFAWSNNDLPLLKVYKQTKKRELFTVIYNDTSTFVISYFWQGLIKAWNIQHNLIIIYGMKCSNRLYRKMHSCNV